MLSTGGQCLHIPPSNFRFRSSKNKYLQSLGTLGFRPFAFNDLELASREHKKQGEEGEKHLEFSG
jgi:hypothetical protein